MDYGNFNILLQNDDLDLFESAIGFESGIEFKNMLDSLERNGIMFTVKQGFDNKSENENIKNFKLIKLYITETSLKEIKEIINLDNFSVNKSKDIYTFNYLN